MRMGRLLRAGVAAACMFGAVAPVMAQTTYTMTGTAGFMQDLDANDGFVYQTEFGAGQTWTAEVVLPAQASLLFAANTQSQGGSRTDYIPISLTNLTITRAGGPPIVLATSAAPLTGTLRFWHRASAGQHFAEFLFTIGVSPTRTTITFSLNAQINDDAAYDLLFVQGTPSANTPDANYFPAFNTAGLRDGQYRTTSLAIDAFVPVFPGRGRYNGNMETFVNAADPNPTPGACCFPNGTCRLSNADGCNTAAGFTWFSGQTCSPSPCPPPTGRCCGLAAGCTITPQANCDPDIGQWTFGATCSPNACPVLGACCQFDGTCLLITEVDCGGDPWDAGATCAPNNCPAPTGACCDSAQACTIVSLSACGTLGGTYLGDNVTCGPTTCTPGACCDPTTLDCTSLTEQECFDNGLEFRGAGVACTPDPCSNTPQPVTVTRAGAGDGTVTSNPAGITCGSVCTFNFPGASVVVLTATPTATSAFAGWSGDCSGTGDCTLTMTAARSVTATFTCRADFNNAGGLTVQDIFDFLAAYFAGLPAADFNGAGGLTVQDIFDYLAAYFAGC